MSLTAPHALRVLMGSVALSMIAGACSSDDSSAGENAGGTYSSQGSGAVGGNTGVAGSIGIQHAGGTGPSTQTCQSAEDCGAEQACHPHAKQCVAKGSDCTSHEACGAGSYCESTIGACLPGSVGSPCASDANCADANCASGVCGCSGLAHEQELDSGPLDIYFIFDRTGSMGGDCSYEPGQEPPVNSKACFATYALSDYLINVVPKADTRLAFQFMSLPDDCDGTPYTTPLVGLTSLPIAANHTLIEEISDERFQGGLGTHIEGALRGLSEWTRTNVTPGREMIGVLMTDGDPNGCEEDIDELSQLIADHLANTGIRTFVIGMEGATDANLEKLGEAGGAEPHDDWCGDVDAPCHYWNVEDGSGNAIESALQAIVRQATPLPCEFDATHLSAPAGETLDFSKVNVTLTDAQGTQTIGQAQNTEACPADQLAWYYDNPNAPTKIHLCSNACNLVTAAQAGSRVNIVVGCETTVRVK